MNLPNKLTLIRIALVPVMILFAVHDFGLGVWANVIAAAVFAVASLTDMLDGKIARKYGLITNFGKFLDPLADKFLVMSALVAMCLTSQNDAYGKFLFVGTVIVIFRELAVTSMRLVVVNSEGIVVAANIYGKIKTCMQIAFVLVAFLEPVIYELLSIDLMRIPSYVLLAGMTLMTVLSGYSYMKSYWKHISTDK